jgi:hypothetical protein
MLRRSILIERGTPISAPIEAGHSARRWTWISMKNLIRVAFAALSLATITPVANAATVDNTRAPVQQDNQIGSPAPGWG